MEATAFLTGFRGTRAEVLVGLKKGQPLTAKELAEQFGVTPNALRRHLKELESEGLVRYRTEVRGVGGPVFAYTLTEQGERLFPRSYDAVLGEALEMVREQFGTAGVVQLFRKRWEDIAERHKAELETLSLHERAARLAQLLTSLGYMAEATNGIPATLVEHNCTIRAVVDRFPEVCAAEQRFIQEVLGVEVTRQAHMAKGANCCEYCLSERVPLVVAPDSSTGVSNTAGTDRPQETT
jgi:DeoR family suf operon transcriptional repressor